MQIQESHALVWSVACQSCDKFLRFWHYQACHTFADDQRHAVQMEVAATWVALRLPMALPLLAMCSPATSRAPGTEPWAPCSSHMSSGVGSRQPRNAQGRIRMQHALINS